MARSKENESKRVAIFGGSFNPPHVGHAAICRWLMELNRFDEIWIIPCFIHPLGKFLIPFDDRLQMCKLAFSKLNLPIKVLEVEKELGGESFTLRTVQHLRKIHPLYRFSFVIGSDVNNEEKLWHRFNMIKELVEIIRVPRGEKSPIPDVSSTVIRHRIGNGLGYRDLIEPEVAIYIVTKAIYHDEDSTKE